MIFIIRLISGIAAVLGVAWTFASPSYEAFVACGGGVVVFLSTFLSSHQSASTAPIAARPEQQLSPRASALLSEIDACTEGSKGLTVILSDSTTGAYRPYLNTSFYDLPGGIGISDISDVVVAAAKLEERGFLFALGATGASRQYKRTEKRA
jgi:hypothetical protein